MKSANCSDDGQAVLDENIWTYKELNALAKYNKVPLPNQLHRLDLELPAELPSLHLRPPVPKTP